jgi:hypothetical protein
MTVRTVYLFSLSLLYSVFAIWHLQYSTGSPACNRALFTIPFLLLLPLFNYIYFDKLRYLKCSEKYFFVSFVTNFFVHTCYISMATLSTPMWIFNHNFIMAIFTAGTLIFYIFAAIHIYNHDKQ